MSEAVIVGAVRTAIAKAEGSLREIRPDDLAGQVLAELVNRTGIETSELDDVMIGCASPVDQQGGNIGRMAGLIAGFPYEVPGVTINRYCGSSLEALNSAAHAIMAGQGELIIAGGVESMTRVPMGADIGSFSEKILDRFTPTVMGITAENVAEKYGVSREDQDDFALWSHQKAVAANRQGRFRREILPIEIADGNSTVSFDTDERPRLDTSLEKLAKLSPVFKPSGTVTAGNSSGINDGSAAVLLTSKAKAKELGLEALATYRGSAVAGVHPDYMGLAPIPATRKALSRVGLTLDDMDVVELHEAFAATALQVVRELGIEREMLNPNGGAVALGHPLGCSGARQMTTLLYEMERRDARYGLSAMCIGFGQGIATVVEREV
ncbi:MAG: thiolase family protein [Candidatus Geothermarchaeales archaeon]